MSEPGSGGDLAKTKATARQTGGAGLDGVGGDYRVTGLKHFGSGSGITRYMITSAVPEGEESEEIFFMDMRGVPWDGSAGVKLMAPWDGHGMTATQSHMMAFEDMPATRLAWPAESRKQMAVTHGTGGFFAAVVVGIVEVAGETARAQLAKKSDALRAFERVEWARVETESWLIQQAYEGMLRVVERGPMSTEAAREGLLGKQAIAELAESVLTRICRTVGGGAYSRYSPFGYWLEDVRALGFLRPPWGLAYDNVFAGSFPPSDG
jgi:alkylation response protein AidB-like acyl-CoA dehydrogenase